jgi:hypothetical protein
MLREQVPLQPRSSDMVYRGHEFEVIQGSTPDVWRWSVLIGNPRMLRIGEATTEEKAVASVKQVIDRALTIQAALKR